VATLDRAMVNLLAILLRGEEWGPQIVRPLLAREDTMVAAVFLVVFAAVGQFLVLNLVSAIFIEAMFKSVKVNSVTLEHEHIYVDQHGAERLKSVFQQIGGGKTSLPWREYREGFESQPELMMSLGVNMELAESLYLQLAFDAVEEVDIDEFVFGLIKLTRQSKTIDMLVLDYQQQRAYKDVMKLSRRFTADTERLQLSTQKLARRLSITLNDCQPLGSTLKARLKTQIERAYRTNDIWNEDEADSEESGDGSEGSSVQLSPCRDRPRSSPSPFLSSWQEVLDSEGRPRIRHELEASLGSLFPARGPLAAGETPEARAHPQKKTDCEWEQLTAEWQSAFPQPKP